MWIILFVSASIAFVFIVAIARISSIAKDKERMMRKNYKDNEQ